MLEPPTKSGLTLVPSRPPFHVPTGHLSWSLLCGLPSGCEVWYLTVVRVSLVTSNVQWTIGWSYSLVVSVYSYLPLT